METCLSRAVQTTGSRSADPHARHPECMRWRIEQIDLNRIDVLKARANEDLMLLVCAASFVESGSDLYSHNLVEFFDGDPDIAGWLRHEWEAEELQHGRALKAYIGRVWPEFDWDTAFRDFFDEYSRTCSVEHFEKSRALEMVARCAIETGTATLYRTIGDCADEPVLREITNNIRTDEIHHYRQFLRHFRRCNAQDRHGRPAVFRALLRRIHEIRNEDSEIALRHVLAARYPDRAGDRAFHAERIARVNELVARNLPAEMCVRMLLKPLDLPAVVQRSLYSPLERGARLVSAYLFFR